MTDPVQQQLEAFNDRDLDAFMDAYAPDARIEDGDGQPMMSGAEELRAFYGEIFSNSPNLHCEILDRIRVGDWTIDEERIEGLQADGFPEQAHAAVAYRVTDGKIGLVRMYM